MAVVRDPCGIVCLIVTYLAVLYSDYVVTRWIIMETLKNRFEWDTPQKIDENHLKLFVNSSVWAPLHVILFNTVVFLLAMAHMKAVFSDPGIVPLPQNRLDFSDMHSKERHDYEREDWTVCIRCETYRPPRAHHCRICKRCIRRMDHHCPWINNCVGEFNQRYFLQFLVYVGVLAVYSIVLVILSWVTPCETCSTDLVDSQARLLHSVLLFLESALFGLFVIAIMVDQIHAILYDETAVEAVQQKGGYKNRPKMALLSDVCGRGPILFWFLPCSNVSSKKYDAPLLSHDV